MTAIVAILNKNGISIATDRVGSIQNGGSLKKYDSSKLFRLSNNNPVGIATYQKSQFMGIPIEIIVKEYRKLNRDIDIENLFLYKDDFLEFLKDFEVDIKDEISDLINNVLSSIHSDIKNELDNTPFSREISNEEIKTLAINKIKDFLKFYTESISSDVSFFTEEEATELYNQNYEKIVELYDMYFGGMQLTEVDSIDIVKILLLEFRYYKIANNIYNNYTGLIISGFGKNDIFPKLIEVKLLYKINGKIIFFESQKVEINNNMSASICPFAQEDVVRNIIQGVNPIVENSIINDLTKENIDSSIIEKIKEKIQKNKDLYSSKMIDSVIHFSLSELGETAETLINLTSFKRKVTMELETVGGETDVAIISKFDGFIWKKRQHYFNKDLNYHYFN